MKCFFIENSGNEYIYLVHKLKEKLAYQRMQIYVYPHGWHDMNGLGWPIHDTNSVVNEAFASLNSKKKGGMDRRGR